MLVCLHLQAVSLPQQSTCDAEANNLQDGIRFRKLRPGMLTTLSSQFEVFCKNQILKCKKSSALKFGFPFSRVLIMNHVKVSCTKLKIVREPLGLYYGKVVLDGLLCSLLVCVLLS